MKKICFLINGKTDYGGVYELCLSIIKELSKSNDVFLVIQKGGIRDSDFAKYVKNVFYLDPISSRNKIARAVKRILHPSLICNKKEFIHYLSKNQFDGIHINAHTCSGFFAKMAHQNNINNIAVHCHGRVNTEHMQKYLRFLVNKNKIYIEKFSTTKFAGGQDEAKSFFLNTQDVHYLMNPINNNLICEKKNILPSDPIKVCQVGRYDRNKNQLFSLEVVHQLQKNNFNVLLSFVGYTATKDEMEYLNELKEYVNVNNLKGVVFLNHDFPKETLFKENHLVLLPSYTEGANLVALEAQCSMTPILCSNHVPRDIDYGLIIFEELNVDDWSSIIVDASRNNLNLKRNNTLLSYSIENYCAQIISYYK